MCLVAATGIYYYRKYADPVYWLQLPGHADCHWKAGPVLYSGYTDPAKAFWAVGPAAGSAGGGYSDLSFDPGDCGLCAKGAKRDVEGATECCCVRVRKEDFRDAFVAAFGV